MTLLYAEALVGIHERYTIFIDLLHLAIFIVLIYINQVLHHAVLELLSFVLFNNC